MIETKTQRVKQPGRLFSEIQWTEEQKAQYQAEFKSIYQRCKVIFDRLQPQLITTHYLVKRQVFPRGFSPVSMSIFFDR